MYTSATYCASVRLIRSISRTIKWELIVAFRCSLLHSFYSQLCLSRTPSGPAPTVRLRQVSAYIESRWRDTSHSVIIKLNGYAQWNSIHAFFKSCLKSLTEAKPGFELDKNNIRQLTCLFISKKNSKCLRFYWLRTVVCQYELENEFTPDKLCAAYEIFWSLFSWSFIIPLHCRKTKRCLFFSLILYWNLFPQTLLTVMIPFSALLQISAPFRISAPLRACFCQ